MNRWCSDHFIVGFVVVFGPNCDVVDIVVVGVVVVVVVVFVAVIATWLWWYET